MNPQQTDKTPVVTDNLIKQIDELNELCITSIDTHNSAEFQENVFACEKLLKGVDYPKGQAYNWVSLAYYYWGILDLDKLKECETKALVIFEELNDPLGILACCNVIIFAKLAKGDYGGAFSNSIRAIHEAEKVEDNSLKGWANYSMGIMYFDTNDFKNGLKYYQKAFDVFTNLEHNFGIARSSSGVGSCYLEMNEFDKALEKIEQSAEMFKSINNVSGLSRSYNDLGVLYRKKGDFKNSEKYLTDALNIRKELPSPQPKMTTYLELGALYCETGEVDKAIEHVSEVIDLVVSSKAKPKELRAQHILYKARKKKGEIEKAFEHLEKFIALKEEVSGSEITQQLKMQESNFASEKAEHQAEIERLKNVELKSAHDMISEKNREITDSINYAKRIQLAILPPQSVVKKYLKNSFILYKPKDIVAGDFYWLEHRDNKTLFAAADCTGHGVPGAMVSVVCNNGLNRSVREHGLVEPGKILDKTREIIIKEFEKAETEVSDGMDIALCSLEGKKLNYAGAHNPLWIIRNKEILETKANKQPIGKFHQPNPFCTHSIDLESGDTIYIFSDGYVDQFGGEKGKKFKTKAFKSLLLSIQDKNMEEQKNIIDQTFEDWKGSLEQIDDVCVIGVRI